MSVAVTLGGIRYCARGCPMTAGNQCRNARLTGDRLTLIIGNHIFNVSQGEVRRSGCWLRTKLQTGSLPITEHPHTIKAIHLAASCR
jgi:hypothetical protein